jgi:hypothetical protein
MPTKGKFQAFEGADFSGKSSDKKPRKEHPPAKKPAERKIVPGTKVKKVDPDLLVDMVGFEMVHGRKPNFTEMKELVRVHRAGGHFDLDGQLDKQGFAKPAKKPKTKAKKPATAKPKAKPKKPAKPAKKPKADKTLKGVGAVLKYLKLTYRKVSYSIPFYAIYSKVTAVQSGSFVDFEYTVKRSTSKARAKLTEFNLYKNMAEVEADMPRLQKQLVALTKASHKKAQDAVQEYLQEQEFDFNAFVFLSP